MGYTISRTRDDKLQAETKIPLGRDRRELRITTAKWTRGVTCRASVVKVSECGSYFEFAIGGRLGDFSKVVAVNPARATEKTIRATHELADVAALTAEALAFYGYEAAL